jgi:CubicO group peptidase (beta-lactamase class C family)
MIAALLAAAPLLAVPQEVKARDVPLRDVAPLLAPIRERHELPALAGAVVADGRVVALGAVGVRAAGEEAQVTVRDRFHIGSCTKAMTATLAGVMVEAGELTWEQTLAQTFPELADDMDPHWRGVTLVDLCTHRSGAPRDPVRGWPKEAPVVEQRLSVLRAITREPPEHEPGPEHHYSNAGYILAGAMLERAGGASWEELMRARLFEPLGMTSAGFGPPDALPDQPSGHSANGAPAREADNPPIYGPAGTVHCSLTDWGRFVAAHLDAGRSDRALLTPATFARLHTPPAGDYALGWGVTARAWAGEGEGPGPVLTHAGSNTRWYAVVWAAPERGFAVLAATNCAGERASKACDEAAWALIRLHLDG